MLDYASEEADDMEEEDRAPTPVNTGRWTATSTYDVYMVDTPSGNGERTPANNGDDSGEAPSRRRKPRKRSKTKKGREAIAGTGENDTPEDLGDPDIPEYPLEDQERPEDQRDPEDPNDSEDDNYLPPVEEEDSPEDEDLIVPETIEDQEQFRQQLLATSRSLKAKARQLKAEQDTLNDRWTRVLSAEEEHGAGLWDQPKSYPRRRLLPQFDDELPNTPSPKHTPYDQPDRPPRG
jgi:hypothetical protein